MTGKSVYAKVTLTCMMAILVGTVGRPALAAPFTNTCTSGTATPAGGCDDTTGSLGMFIVWISNAHSGFFRSLVAGEAGWNPVTHEWTSAVLEDHLTKIGRSYVFAEGSPADLGGVRVGSANTMVSDAMLSNPFGDLTSPWNEFHTELRSMNLLGGLCPCGGTYSPTGILVRGGTAAAVPTPSFGEVEAQSPFSDFPARSFFNVFVEIDLPFGIGTLHNLPGDPLVVKDTNLTTLPPKVVYKHGGTSAVPVYFKNGPYVNELFGYLRLAGHLPNGFCHDDTSFTYNCADANILISELASSTPMKCSACNDLCAGLPDGTPCNDGDLCTQTDLCQAGACVGSPTQCNDGNGCTIDACDPLTGQCVYTPKDCNDNLICTNDACDPTGECIHTPVDCDDGNLCTIDSCVQSLAVPPECTVTPDGTGKVKLPPNGCDYLTASQVHGIINGLPSPARIEFGARHRDFLCAAPLTEAGVGASLPTTGLLCSFTASGCDEPGGTLGGEKECPNVPSTLELDLRTFDLPVDFVRSGIQMPVFFETHVGPRNASAPFQSFPTLMYRLRGDLPPNDPDFDLLRITAGTDYGYPSAGHTTIRQRPDGRYTVDSYFDMNYRIDFHGKPGGRLSNLGGFTLGMVRMQTGTGVGCTHTLIDCDDGNACTDDWCDPTNQLCVHVPDDTNPCSDGNACTAPDVCRSGQCVCDNAGPCPGGTITSYTNTTPVAIPTGPGVVTSSITVGPGADPFLNRLRLTTNVLHANNADLDITLTSPSGITVTITSDNGGVNDNVFNGTLWDDQANPGGAVPYTSNNGVVTDAATTNNVVLTPVVVEEALGAFYGTNPNGVWTLSVSDDLAANGGTLTSWGLELATLPAAPISTTTSFTNATPTALADSPALSISTLPVSGAGSQIGKLRLTTFIRHTFPGDLDMTLTSPSGKVITISTDNGAGADNVFNGTLWDDDADPGNTLPFPADTFAASKLVTDTTYTTLVVKPTLVPEEALAAFQGEDPNGTWMLTVSDDAPGDTGSLDQWTLEITTTRCSLPCDVDCDDHNPCTDDLCDPLIGCVHVANDANACSDANVCTTSDHCAGGLCVGMLLSCDDGDICTDDTCDPLTGCAHAANNAPCDDGNVCTSGDTCGASPAYLVESFDGVTAPALPAGWATVVTPAGQNPWTTTAAFSVSAPNSATTDTPTVVSDKTLDAPARSIQLGANQLDFENRWNLESTYDGAVLEIMIGAGSFQDILAAGGSFVTGGYNATISTTTGSPIAGRQAWSGTSSGFVHTTVRLPLLLPGTQVALRWRVASDSSVAATAPNGQWIDNVRLSSLAHICQAGSATNCDDAIACTSDSCDPLVGCVHTPGPAPDEVDGGVRLSKSGGTATIVWNVAGGAISSDVVRGLLGGLPVGPGGGDETCIDDDTVLTSTTDAASPAAGGGFWYLVRGTNPCGSGPYGYQGLHGVPSTPRVSSTCP